MFLIIGTGRSGTNYCSALLNEQGIKTGHETIYRPKGRESTWWKYRGDVSWLALPDVEQGRFTGRVVHVVRDPTTCIRSLLRTGRVQRVGADSTPWTRFGRRHCPEAFEGGDAFTQACMFWEAWNLRCERVSHMTIRLEYLTLGELLLAVRQEGNGVEPAVSRTINRREKIWEEWPIITWEDLPESTRRVATHFGYSAAGSRCRMIAPSLEQIGA